MADRPFKQESSCSKFPKNVFQQNLCKSYVYTAQFQQSPLFIKSLFYDTIQGKKIIFLWCLWTTLFWALFHINIISRLTNEHKVHYVLHLKSQFLKKNEHKVSLYHCSDNIHSSSFIKLSTPVLAYVIDLCNYFIHQNCSL